MEYHHGRSDPNQNSDLNFDQFKKNGEMFRNTMERIFQKVSSFLLANVS